MRSFIYIYLISHTAAFNLHAVSLEPAPKPLFLVNATYDVVAQFMAIYRMPKLTLARKMNELDILVSTLRSEVQYSYNNYKAESFLRRLAEDERMIDIMTKTHYTIAHLAAMKESRIGRNERKKRVEMVFAEYGDFIISAITDEMSNILDQVVRSMLRAYLFTERLSS